MGKPFLQGIRKEFDQSLRHALSDLEYLRNQIAHGGARNASAHAHGFPQAANLPNQYKRSAEAVKKMFAALQ
jgi:hypothetical protein